MESFISFISQLSAPDEKIKEELLEIVETKMIAKGRTVFSPNRRCQELFFVNSGLVKMLFHSDGDQFIMRFFEENTMFTDLESSNTKRHSKYEVIALEDTELVVVPFYSFENLCLKHHALETFYRKFLTIANLNMMARIKEMLEEDAKKRYENFVLNYPHIVQRINLGDLSGYLGITQVSLSRIRAQK